MFGDPWPNTVFSIHDYALPGLVDGGDYPGLSRGRFVDRDVIAETFKTRTAYMVAASCAFINPAGFQTNLMVQKDGGYGFMDFARVGVPITLIVGVVVLVLAPILYGF